MNDSVREPRVVVVHYHLFKNAGTSLDRAFIEQFGDRWMNVEATASHALTPEQLAAAIVTNRAVDVFSSHTAHLPIPNIPGVMVIPAVFVRHPIDRAWSVYAFERTQEQDTRGSVFARAHGFAEYVEWRLGIDNVIADFQSFRLAMAGRGASRVERALDAVDTLPFVGLVESYAASLDRLQVVLEPHFPGIAMPVLHANASEPRPDVEGALGPELYARLVASNRFDIEVWVHVARSYGHDIEGA